MTPRKIVLGITGASGAPYAKRLAQVLRERVRTGEVEVGVCLSSTASEVWSLECGGDIREELGLPVYGARDYRAPFASGSAGWHAMAVVPAPPNGSNTTSPGRVVSLMMRSINFSGN